MNSYIKGVAIFQENPSEKRYVRFERGLNIITGWEHTGKSSIFDIIDYCFCNSSFPVPAGEITDFADIYAIILSVNNNSFLIARKPEGKFKKLIYINNISENINVDSIEKIDLEADDQKLFTISGAFVKFEEMFNLKVSNGFPLINFDSVTEKTDIRSIFAFMFIHQNTIDDKKNLFYNKVNPSHFPTLAGWVNQEYFSTLENLKSKKSELKKKEKEFEEIQRKNKYFVEKLVEAFKVYYSYKKKTFDENFNLEDLLKEAKELIDIIPPIPSLPPTEISEKQSILKDKLTFLNRQALNVKKELEKIKEIQKAGNSAKLTFSKLKKRVFHTHTDYKCPICDTINLDLKNEAIKIIEADKWLDSELSAINNTNIDYSNEIEQLQTELNNILDLIKPIHNEYTNNEKILKNIQNETIEQLTYKAQLKVETATEFLNENYNFEISDKGIEKLKGFVESLEKLKNDFEVINAQKRQNAQKLINQILNEYAKLLNFGYEPINLYVDIESKDKNGDFVFYQIQGDNKKNKTVTLEQMGGGSNLVAAHISLFLSFMYYFAVSENARVPSILMLDQPSKGYFTRSKDLDSDNAINKVANIYLTLEKMINRIENEKKYKPQIIVTDQVEYLGKHSKDLEKYFCKNKSNGEWINGKGFV